MSLRRLKPSRNLLEFASVRSGQRFTYYLVLKRMDYAGHLNRLAQLGLGINHSELCTKLGILSLASAGKEALHRFQNKASTTLSPLGIAVEFASIFVMITCNLRIQGSSEVGGVEFHVAILSFFTALTFTQTRNSGSNLRKLKLKLNQFLLRMLAAIWTSSQDLYICLGVAGLRFEADASFKTLWRGSGNGEPLKP